MKHALALLAVCTLGAALCGCTTGQSKTTPSSGAGGGMQAAAPDQVVIDRRKFMPSTLTVAPGTTVGSPASTFAIWLTLN